ncbi:MAG: hypothetical protein ABIJ86_03910, partial [Spirochaetota bacterium]
VRNDRSLVVNLGSEEGLSVMDIVESARRLTGKPIPARLIGRRAGDPARLVASSALAREALGWRANYSDVDTLVRTSWAVYQEAAMQVTATAKAAVSH